ncbi:recombinase family protein [Yersinia enterocolitica]|nr:recombinase family protein [Yersinia enterocolitica]ELI7990142.1 recombinase family protein [Yersinia enterocolitica]
MSTDHQRYSLSNQSEFLREYADKNGMDIIYTYDDSGKSGVTAKRRTSFHRLIDDVSNHRIDIRAVLVFDMSRFGRFQSLDQFGYYTQILKNNNVKIVYCADPISEDDNDYADFKLFMARKEASSFSKNLSRKVFIGQINLVKRGYHQGGLAGYGLRRMLIDESHHHKGILKYKEWKSIQTDRVILVPGPENELEVVNAIFDKFNNEKISEAIIAVELNRCHISAENGSIWTRAKVHEILTNEKYIGNNVYNRRSFKLKQVHTKNPRDEWIRCDNAYEKIVSKEKFLLAQLIINSRKRVYHSDEELLSKLEYLLKTKGKLSGFIIDEDDTVPSSGVYRKRFGSLFRAYELINYKPKHDYQYLIVNSFLKEKYNQIVSDLIREITKNGCYVDYNEESKLFIINENLKLSVILSRSRKLLTKTRWKIRLDRKYKHDICIVIRLNGDNTGVKDYYIFPSIEFLEDELIFTEINNFKMDLYRRDSLKLFMRLIKRKEI